MGRIKTLLAAAALLVPLLSSADEGMWMIQDINAALEARMRERGLRLGAKEIYNADAPGTTVADAVVSLGFYCTGSVISDHGLVITNHHCAYSNVARISTPEHNYLEEGFWAMTSDQEIPIEGEKFYFLKRVFDVTDEVKAAGKRYETADVAERDRQVKASLEKRYSESTGLACILSYMWVGEKAYMSAYKVYTDVRLVAVPPVCIGYFGGESDNWTWPRHNCDFAMYRIYENGVPVTSERNLKVSLKGYEPGSFAMVIGYPGWTDRYASSAEVEYQEKVSLPVSNRLRTSRLRIIRGWMDSDPAVRGKYSDWYFSLSNSLENNVGMAECYKRFRVKDEKEAQEGRMQAWIDAASNREEMWGNLIPDLREAYSRTAMVEKDKVLFRETVLSGTFIGRFLLGASHADGVGKAKETLLSGMDATDPRVERALLENAVEEYFTHLDSYYYGPFQRRLQDRFGYDFTAMTDYLWEGSLVSSKSKVAAIESMEEFKDDRLLMFLTDVTAAVYNDRNGHIEERSKASELEREYKRALYWMRLQKGELQYPDANSTMRISYGTVGGFSPSDGTWCNWYSTPKGIFQKYDPSNHDYDLNPRQKALLDKGGWGRWGFRIDGKRHGMIVDFLTDNDIAGGNSGSPVLNAYGDLIGLAFDGNLESLASDTSYTVGYNKCINTDIRFVLWVLDKYAGLKRIIKEIDFS